MNATERLAELNVAAFESNGHTWGTPAVDRILALIEKWHADDVRAPVLAVPPLDIWRCDRCDFTYYAQVICPKCNGIVNQPIVLAVPPQPQTPEHPFEVVDGEWFWPTPQDNFLWGCCDCGLFHRCEFRIVMGQVEMRVHRDHSATTARRAASARLGAPEKQP